jgi:hypothetical protein
MAEWVDLTICETCEAAIKEGNLSTKNKGVEFDIMLFMDSL